ncbi:MAG: hypothetical protein HZB51_06150 [Chloroflexi bacterium]|nr:hypothetical protein [Chloroflexota bacterium]
MDAENAQWNPGSNYWFDVAEFKQQSANSDRLADTVALYSGDLLKSVYADWLFYPREQLRALYFTDLNQLILHYRVERDYVRALEYARQLRARAPLREDTMRQLIALRYETGDRSGALFEFE